MHERAVGRFLSIATAIGLAGFAMTQVHGKLELHTTINAWHASWADAVFPSVTYLADGWVPTFISVLLLARNWRSFLMLACSAAFSAIVVQALKHTVFADVDRPMGSLMAMPGLHLVPGIEMLHRNSFPSGHSTCAFSMCFAICVLVDRAGWSIVLALLAGLMAFSRVYLSQHFTEDALAGLAIGTITGWLVYRWLYRSPMAGRKWLERSPFRRQGQ